MKPVANGDQGPAWVARRSAGYAYSCAAIFALAGLLMFYSASGEARRLMQILTSVDAVLGVSNETLLNIGGGLHLVLAVWLLVIREPLARGMLTGWAGFNYLIYYLGMSWMKAAAPYPCVRAVGMRAGIAPATLDIAWKMWILVLLTGAGMIAMAEWRCRKRLKDSGYMEQWRQFREGRVVQSRPQVEHADSRSPIAEGTADRTSTHVHVGLTEENLPAEVRAACPNCGQHIRCDIGYGGVQIICPACKKNITLHRTPDLKMSCFFCQGHIQFPAHALGRKMPCPHCKMDITLMEPLQPL